MVARNAGLVLEIGDGTGYDYRGTLFYSLVKISIIHLNDVLTADLRERKLDGITSVALTPGFLRSEWMLNHWGITEGAWQERVRAAEVKGLVLKGEDLSETPRYIGRAVAALASDPNVSAKQGQSLSTWGLVDEYDFRDIDGRQPRWTVHPPEPVSE